ncbi:MAG: hypothetical protein WBG46_06185 [Nonlabens sp.]
MEQNDQNKQQYAQSYAAPRSNNLNTLAILHLVKAILTFLFSLFFVLYMFMGKFIGDMAEVNSEMNSEFNISAIFVIIGTVGMLFCILFGVLNLLSYSYLSKKKNYNFIFAVSIINCLTGILGILLGVFTLIEINKPEVKSLFKNC